jgi:nicotinamidase-related amidase
MKKIKIIVTFICLAAAAIIIIFTSVYIRFSTVSQGKPIPQSNVVRSALLVIDIQEGLSGESSTWYHKGYADQSETLTASVNRTIDMAVSAGIPVVYITHEDTDPVVKFITGSHMIKGKAAAAIDKRIKIVSENRFTKNIMDGFSNDDLQKFLMENKINRLYMTGLDAEYCVYRTSRAAKNRGYSVNLIEDAVISSTVEKKLNILKKYKSYGIDLITVEDFKSLSVPLKKI